MPDDYKVERTNRAVIEKKLLDCLTDESVVAALLSRDDLIVLIEALLLSENQFPSTSAKARDLRVGLQTLERSAFS